jgi:hypothetical protein
MFGAKFRVRVRWLKAENFVIKVACVLEHIPCSMPDRILSPAKQDKRE